MISTYLLALIPALLGFLFIEVISIKDRDCSKSFSPSYYIKNNLVVIMGNALGFMALIFTLPDFLVLQQRYLDMQLPFLTGLIIGLLGGAIIRGIQQFGKALIRSIILKFGKDGQSENGSGDTAP